MNISLCRDHFPETAAAMNTKLSDHFTPAFRRQVSGVALFETTLIITLTMIMLALLLELGLLLAAQFDLSHAAREGARLASLLGPYEEPAATSIREAVKNKVLGELYFLRMYENTEVAVDNPEEGDSSLKFMETDGSLYPCTYRITVTVALSIKPVLSFFQSLTRGSHPMTRRTSMRWQHQSLCNHKVI